MRTSTNYQVDEAYMEKYWAKVDSLQLDTLSLSWHQTSGYTYNYEFAKNEVSIIFKYRYRGTESQVYTMRLMKMLDPLLLMVNGDGEIIAEDNIALGKETSQAKGDVVDSYTIKVGDAVLNYSYLPSGYTVISDLLKKTVFLERVKQLKPWGDRKYLLIPILLKDNNTGEEIWSSISFIYYI